MRYFRHFLCLLRKVNVLFIMAARISGLLPRSIFQSRATLFLWGLVLLPCSNAAHIQSYPASYRLLAFYRDGTIGRRHQCLIYMDTGSSGHPWNSMPYDNINMAHQNFRPSLFKLEQDWRNGPLLSRFRSKHSQKYLSVCRNLDSSEIRLKALQDPNSEAGCETWFQIEAIPKCIEMNNTACTEREFAERSTKYYQIKPTGFHNQCLFVNMSDNRFQTQNCPELIVRNCEMFDLNTLKNSPEVYNYMRDVIELKEIYS